jgi:hypothetical protein
VVGANGCPLDMVGQVKIYMTIGDFTCEQSFVVVQNLTVPCLLGADFLINQAAVIDCKKGEMTLAGQFRIPIEMNPLQGIPSTTFNVTAAADIEIAGGTIQMIAALVNNHVDDIQEGLFEPVLKEKVPAHFLLARSLNHPSRDGEIFLQVMNTGSAPFKIYKNMTLGEFTPRQQITVIEQEVTPSENQNTETTPSFSAEELCNHLRDREKSQLAKVITSFQDLFTSASDPLGRTSLVKHPIITDGPPIRQPVRRLPEALKPVVDNEVKRMLHQGVIRHSQSPWSSPIVMVQKKDLSWRLCIDYRRVNDITHRDAYPIPRIDAALDSLAGSKWFTTLDLASGYWQVEIKEEDKEKTAFSTRLGHFEFNVMPFGLTNAPATFQRLMECVLAGLNEEQCLTYIDIIIFGSTFEEHLDRLVNILLRIRKAGLKLQTKKCHFCRKQVRYLGHIISAEGVQPDKSKTIVVANYPQPKDATQLRQFLGLTNYYRRFIGEYSKIARPLHDLLKKSTTFQWNQEAQWAFDTFKQKLTNPPILAYPDFTKIFIVHTDASESAIGGVLSQKFDEGEKVIAYWSRQLRKAERGYSTIEREALAIVAAVKEFYPYLYGFEFVLVTDHNPLVSLKNLKDVGGRISRWLLFLQQFNFKINYRPGKQHVNADSLSRISPTQMVTLISPLQEYSWDELRMAQSQDTQLRTIVAALGKGEEHPPATSPGLKRTYLANGLLWRDFKECSTQVTYTQFVVPSSFRELVCKHVHDHSGHLGYLKTLNKLKERFYWPGYENDVKTWLQDCERCQKRNPPQPTPRAPLGTIPANTPFQRISWDIMGPLPATANGSKYILVITDLFSKWVEAFPLRSTDSETLAVVMFNEFICRYGVPHYLHSDQGANLTSKLVQSLCKHLGIQRTQTSSYHPQGNGQVERFNRTLEAMLAKLVNDHHTDWDRWIPTALFAYRTAVHESTGYSPYRVNFGHSPTLPVDVILGLSRGGKEDPDASGYVRKATKYLETMFETVRKRLGDAHRRSKDRYDLKVAGTRFSVGDRVWLFIPVTKKGRSKKFGSFWRGPYTVIDKVNDCNYRIQLIGTSRTLIVHRNRLKLFW